MTVCCTQLVRFPCDCVLHWLGMKEKPSFFNYETRFQCLKCYSSIKKEVRQIDSCNVLWRHFYWQESLLVPFLEVSSTLTRFIDLVNEGMLAIGSQDCMGAMIQWTAERSWSYKTKLLLLSLCTLTVCSPGTSLTTTNTFSPGTNRLALWARRHKYTQTPHKDWGSPKIKNKSFYLK